MTGIDASDQRRHPDVGPERVTVLGSTGSIGDNTLDVIARHPARFQVFALSGKTRLDKLFEQCVRFRPGYAVTDDAASAAALSRRFRDLGVPTNVLHGSQGLSFVASHEHADVVVTGIVGAAGLLPTLAAVEGRRRVLVANKEPLVMMGAVIMERAARSGATIIPLDSEHNAIFQCLPDGSTDCTGGGVKRLLLTASGGPFRTLDASRLADVTPAEAVAHPNWSMGPKISVDSATLMNKGLELIEACVLFGMNSDDVGVVIHPQSTIHSMVEYVDGSVIAQMGAPDMRIPIAHGLGWPDRIDSGAASLDFGTMIHLDFEPPDEVRFPCLRLARDAARIGGIAPIVLNAANEVAVDAFLEGRLAFDQIPTIIESTLQRVDMPHESTLEGVLRVDNAAREAARELVTGRLAR